MRAVRLLLLLGLLFPLPLVAGSGTAPAEASRVSVSAAPRPAARYSREGCARPRLVSRGRRLIGVASANIHSGLNGREVRHDVRRLASMKSLHMIGWQEVSSRTFRTALPILRRKGWRTAFFPKNMGTQEVAVSWRPWRLQLLRASQVWMHRNAERPETARPFPRRYVTVAQFKARRGRIRGTRITLLNTHANSYIQHRTRFRRTVNARMTRTHYSKLARLLRKVPGQVVIGTGDLNFDWGADKRGRPRGGIHRTIGREARSSYDRLGNRRICPTRDARWIDYTFLARRSSRYGARFHRHATLGGLATDHRALLTWIRVPARHRR